MIVDRHTGSVSLRLVLVAALVAGTVLAVVLSVNLWSALAAV